MHSEQAPASLPSRPRAAQYIRMSTDRQVYSTEGQAAAIAVYAVQRDIDIVRTYKDEGRSGLSLHGRKGLQQLLADVQGGQADFSLILVYDVSRWGRFQDIDESAHYEFICKQMGIRIIYSAEQFENDESVASTILKTLKRVMAGEYSRELGVKVRSAQCRAAARGFRQGGPPPFGLRRLMIDKDRRPKAKLASGEVKSLQSDRIILVPGPRDDVDTVRFIFRAFVNHRHLLKDIAALLNERNKVTRVGAPWTPSSVRNVLNNPAYAGHNRYNQTRRDMRNKRRKRKNSAEQWVVARDAFQPLVSAELFEAAQRGLALHRPRVTNDQILEQLRRLLATHGSLSQRIIKAADHVTSLTTIRNKFGGLQRAYEEVGFIPSRDPIYVATRRRLRELKTGLLEEVQQGLRAAGATARIISTRSLLLLINEKVSVGSVVARRRTYESGIPMWRIVFETARPQDYALVRLVDDDMRSIVGHYLFTGSERKFDRSMCELTINAWEGNRLESLLAFCAQFAPMPMSSTV